MYLLDTNTVIRYLNGRAPHVRTRLQTTPANEIVVCSIVKAELFFGAMRRVHKSITSVSREEGAGVTRG